VKVATPQPTLRPGVLWPIDKLFIAYAAIMVCLLALAARHDSFSLVLILGHVVAIGLLLVLARSSCIIGSCWRTSHSAISRSPI
jgi:hypothetical protein